MGIKLNETQAELLKNAQKKGFLTVDDFKLYYTSPITIKANIERFILLGHLKNSEIVGRFDYAGEKK